MPPLHIRQVAMEILRRYQHSWESDSPRPELTEFLSGLTEELADEELVALIKHDQEQRWSLGDIRARRNVESYCDSILQLGTKREQLIELIANEFQCRRRAGEAPRLEEYAQRFPDLVASLPMALQEPSIVRPVVAEPAEIEAICDAFEEELSQGRLPEIGQWLGKVVPALREQLFRELLPIELWWLHKRNAAVDPRPYLRRFPEFQFAIEELWSESTAEFLTVRRNEINLDTAVDSPATPERWTHPGDIRDTGLESENDVISRATVLSNDVINEHALGGAPNKLIGQYRLLEQLGEGGMGTVWRAIQEKPVRRIVALKLIKMEIGSKETINRFEAERQALALMDHPHISRILDAGTTVEGFPYFAMELVEGQPLTVYCDQNRLGIEQRLRLFIDVCAGVQHAHQKGIIHRDIKPGNILVSTIDGTSIPKVIDFGLAKAMDSCQKLTEQSLFTGIGQVMGTLKYMSPEQASPGSVDIDTRSDIYSLGVVLYELLAGCTPLDEQPIKEMSLLDVLELIRDKNPMRPSNRLRQLGNASTVVTNARRTDPASLTRILLGDLDWVVMKALEKDRSRRYETASGFAADIQHYLHSEPVTARPPSLLYQVRKFVKKNKVGVATALTIFMTLAIGMAGTSWGLYRAEIKSRDAEAARDAEKEQKQQEIVHRQYAEAITDFVKNDFLALTSVTGQAQESEDEPRNLTKDSTLRDLLDRAAERLGARTDLNPNIKHELERIVGVSYRNMGEPRLGIKHLEVAVQIATDLKGEDSPEAIETINQLGIAYLAGSRLHEALHLQERNLTVGRLRLGNLHPTTIAILLNLADIHSYLGNFDAAFPLLEETIKLQAELEGADGTQVRSLKSSLAHIHYLAADFATATTILEQLLNSRSEDEDSSGNLQVLVDIANVLAIQGKFEQAAPTYQKALAFAEETYEDGHPYITSAMNNLAALYRGMGRNKEAIDLMEKVLKINREKLGASHQDTIAAMGNLGTFYQDIFQSSNAFPLFVEAYELTISELGREHPYMPVAAINMGRGHLFQFRPRLAIRYYLEAGILMLGDRKKSALLEQEIYRDWTVWPPLPALTRRLPKVD